MDLEELYGNIFEMQGVMQHPGYHGFSYGVLIVMDDRPVMCYYLDDSSDQKLQYILSHGMIQIFGSGARQMQIFYGYVTDGERFFCEEQVYPRQNQVEGGLL